MSWYLQLPVQGNGTTLWIPGEKVSDMSDNLPCLTRRPTPKAQRLRRKAGSVAPRQTDPAGGEKVHVPAVVDLLAMYQRDTKSASTVGMSERSKRADRPFDELPSARQERCHEQRK